MGQMNLRRYGEGAANGVITMRPDPDYTRGKEAREAIPVGAFGGHKLASVRITGTATCAMEGCNGDPSVAANWQSISSTSSTGTLTSQDPWQFIRFVISAYTSGTVFVNFEAVNN